MLTYALMLWLFPPAAGGEGFLDDLLAHYRDRLPLQQSFGGDLAAAVALQDRFVAALADEWGPVVGYKAALTAAAAQQRFGVDHPLSGMLLREMLLENGARLPVSFAARGLYEADLLVRIGSETFNQAHTRAEALASLDAVIPFLELPDLVYAAGIELGGPDLVAINTGARRGVLGDIIPLSDLPDAEAALGGFIVSLSTDSGNVPVTGVGANLLGHPLDAALWLKDTLQARGIQFHPGDLLSLGSITPLQPVTGPATLRARYTGLVPGRTLVVSVTFVP